IRGLTDSLSGLTPSDWKSVVSRLRRAKLLTAEDEREPSKLDTHPLIREYFGEQPRIDYKEAWQTCNARLYDYYRALGARLPSNLAEMEPLFSAVRSGCKAGLFRTTLPEVYLP